VHDEVVVNPIFIFFQIIKLKENMSNAKTLVQANEMKIRHNEKEIKRMEQEMKKSDADYKRDSANLKKYEDAVAGVEGELSSIGYEEGLAERLDEERANLKHESQGLRRRIDEMSSRFQWLNLQYSDPEPNFDRSQVLGAAAKLVTVKDKRFFQALDTAGGGKVRSDTLNGLNRPRTRARLLERRRHRASRGRRSNLRVPTSAFET